MANSAQHQCNALIALELAKPVGSASALHAAVLLGNLNCPGQKSGAQLAQSHTNCCFLPVRDSLMILQENQDKGKG